MMLLTAPQTGWVHYCRTSSKVLSPHAQKTHRGQQVMEKSRHLRQSAEQGAWQLLLNSQAPRGGVMVKDLIQ